MGKAGPGYRKPKTKKYFTRKDIISTSIIVAIIIVAIIIVGVMISRDDFIRIKDGKLAMEPNWLISNYSDNNTYMYYKVGEIGDIEGYTLTEGSAQSPIKAFTPDDENATLSSIYLGTFEYNYKTVVEGMKEFYADTSDPVDLTINGRDAQYIISFSPAEDAEAPAEDTEAPAEDAEVPAEDAEAPAEDAEAPAEDAEAPAEDAEAPAEDAEAPAEDAEAPAEDAEVPAEDAEAVVEGVDVVSAEDLWLMVAYIDYDEDHSIYIQLNSDHELTTEEAEAELNKVTSQLTIVDR